jgi:poly(ADP-ribose) glycohydrolase ARH3
MPLPESAFVGSLLGLAVGDALGAPFEGLTSEIIYHSFGRPSDIVAAPPVDALLCTDDTHMTLGLAECLTTHGRVDQDALAGIFARNFDPARGYGAGAARLLHAVRDGGDWRAHARATFPDGSFGNGAAMRAAPVGLFFADDLGRVAAEAAEQARVTHAHPLGVEGAVLLAVAAAIAARGGPFHAEHFYGELYPFAREEEFQWLLRTAYKLTPADSLACLGNSLEAHRSVVTALACFAGAPDSYPTAVARALAQGNDVDTLMAMTGALSGARLGPAAVPGNLVARLEEGPLGRSRIVEMAKVLYARAAGHAA